MTWTDVHWDAFCTLVEEAWHGEFDDHARTSWRILLDAVAPAAASEGLRRLLLEGHQHRPAVSVLLAAIRRDPSAPTFTEAIRLILGPGGVLAARHSIRGPFVDDPDDVEDPRTAATKRREAERTAMQQRLDATHPLVAAFFVRTDPDRLNRMPLDDPDWGEKVRRDLEREWDQHVAAFDGREVAALAAGRRNELAPFDPLAALGLRPRRGELEEGGRPA